MPNLKVYFGPTLTERLSTTWIHLKLVLIHRYTIQII
jgi:hypothetical protein